MWVTVVEQAGNTWLSVLKLIKHYEGLTPSKRPKNKSYETLVSCVKDQFIIIKFFFFKDIADHLQTFLKGFQTDAHMVALMALMSIRHINEKIFEDIYQKYNCCRCKHPISFNQNKCK